MILDYVGWLIYTLSMFVCIYIYLYISEYHIKSYQSYQSISTCCIKRFTTCVLQTFTDVTDVWRSLARLSKRSQAVQVRFQFGFGRLRHRAKQHEVCWVSAESAENRENEQQSFKDLQRYSKLQSFTSITLIQLLPIFPQVGYNK